MHTSHATILHYVGRDDDAREAAAQLENSRDGTALYTIAFLQCMTNDRERGFKTFRKALDAGFKEIHSIRGFLNDENILAEFAGRPEYEELCRIADKIEGEQVDPN